MKFRFMIFLLLSGSLLMAEDSFPYERDLFKDGVLTGAGLLLSLVPYTFENPPPASEMNLNSNDISFPDSAWYFNHHPALDLTSDIFTVTGFLLPSLLAFDRNTDENLTLILMYSEVVLLSWGVKEVMKGLITRYRPYSYFGTAHEKMKEDKSADSFPSGHTALAFSGASFFTAVFHDLYPDSEWKWPVTAASFTAAGTAALLRVRSGNHFISDVLAGAGIGTAVGMLVPWLHKKDIDLSLVPWGEEDTALVMSFHL